jgi:hypothetical protein
MGELGGAALILFLFYFVFMFVAQFIIGQILIVIGSIALAFLAYSVCKEVKAKTLFKFLTCLLITVLLGIGYYNSLFSETSCDNYYMGKFTRPRYGPEQNGVSISQDNYSKICNFEFQGFRHACSQYDECRSGLTALKPLPLFLFGLLCASLGWALGLFPIGKFNETKGEDESNYKAQSTNIQNSNKQITLQTFQEENPILFKESTVEEISRLTGRTERSIKTFITRKKLYCVNYGSKDC